MQTNMRCEDDIRAIEEEEARVERRMTAREIFTAGFKFGLEMAGLRSDPNKAFDDWLLGQAP